MVFQAAKRIAQLDAAHEGLVFGRLDLRTELDPEPRYIGRIGLRDEQPRLAADRLAGARGRGVLPGHGRRAARRVRRRVLRCAGPQVVGVEDELLDAEAETDLPIVGEGALMAQLSRARDRSMHSIVATIQAEQDKAIRAPGKGVVAISGGPGTGKTVVALHRAAYLLYTDRRRYETRRRARRRPVAASSCATSSGCCRRSARPRSRCARSARSSTACGRPATTTPAVADVKGSARMAELMRRTARQQAPGLAHRSSGSSGATT